MLTALTLTAALASCAPSATPTPTPSETGFASEAEAFAAAEETYRAYVDAYNGWITDERGQDPLALLAGQALVDETKNREELEEAGLHIRGSFQVSDFAGQSWTSDQVQALVCLDLSGVRVETDAGEDTTPKDRSDANLLEVRFRAGADDIRIISSLLRSEEC
ncbi:hypothetical protein KZX37_13495 [Microbacterium sp. EYE_5]|uniref:hypothetical protein n=1 Tax=unclassified Microbacterium TaxID=2609290 RepID=UPI0020062AE9|nr:MULTISPECIES: hypothetical protein [unclassified Microbacterium]MCK6080480.1 hypothetical protein [Microbacterium sp. EYE_382]MCK6085751.1 hypothetical protein [Microbacterium sp. EYE_384]MCK6124751.1 hypothetical protein [Microbacterium sp. EYE_80]MCK6127660.1 hypothetical protein [Microbacterium sp. EYE_79]MCK6141435.1 hypothetical protein [Microbacterium sp. EYE_39]